MEQNNINLRNLIKLSEETKVNIFNKNKNLKNKIRIIKTCEIIKKKELKSSSLMLSNLAKLNPDNSSKKIQIIYDNLKNKIDNIEQIIICVNNLENDDDYNECYNN